MTPGEYVSVKGEERESWLKVLKAIFEFYFISILPLFTNSIKSIFHIVLLFLHLYILIKLYGVSVGAKSMTK